MFSPEVTTFFLAMTPLGELRLALPVALEVYHLPPFRAWALAVAGNLLASILVFLAADPAVRVLRRIRVCNRMCNRVFERTRKKFSGVYATYGAVALALFVAIPLPLTGGWTGALAAYLFGFSFGRTAALLTAGIAAAGVIVLLADLGIVSAFKIFL